MYVDNARKNFFEQPLFAHLYIGAIINRPAARCSHFFTLANAHRFTA